MNKTQSYLIFLIPEIVPYLESTGIFEINKINSCDYIACSKIHDSPLFLDLTISRHHLWNHFDHDILISLPIRSVVYICSVQDSDLTQILGFRNKTKDENNQPEIPSP